MQKQRSHLIDAWNFIMRPNNQPHRDTDRHTEIQRDKERHADTERNRDSKTSALSSDCRADDSLRAMSYSDLSLDTSDSKRD